MSNQRNVLLTYFGILLATLLVFRLTHATAILFLPLIAGLVICSRYSIVSGVCTFVLYLSAEGALKLMSDYSLPLRLGPDLLIIALLFQAMRKERVQNKQTRFFAAPYSILFWIHVGWCLVEFCNPFSIGLDSSLAGYKVYVSSLLLYFITYLAIESDESLTPLSWCMLGAVSLQTIFAIEQFSTGEMGLAQWSPHYATALGVSFRGVFFRPFGLSNVPGGASTMLYILAPVCLSVLIKQKRYISIIACTLFLSGIGYVLFVSQIRAALIKCMIGLFIFSAATALRTSRGFWQISGIVAFGFVAISWLLGMNDPRLENARKRVDALSKIQSVWDVRSEGTTESILRIVSEQPFGLGLSRVGAGSAPFRDRIEADQRYGAMWSFADNLYKALLIEIGVPGAFFFLAFLIAVTYRAFRLLIVLWRNSPPSYPWMIAAAAGVFTTFLGHLGSEGFLYQPEAGLVWLLLGAVVKTGTLAVNERRREAQAF